MAGSYPASRPRPFGQLDELYRRLKDER